MKRLAVFLVTLLALPAIADRIVVEDDSDLATTVFESLEPCGEVIPPVNPDAPPTPSDLVLVPDISSIAVSWVSGGGTTDSFEVLYCEGPGCTNFGNSQTTSGTTASLTGLNEDTDYRVYLHALNSDGVSSNGIVGSAATGGLPTVPGRLLVAPFGNTLALAAVPSDDSTEFGYRWCEGSGCTSFGTPVTGQGETYQIADLDWDTSYEVQARAENEWGESGWTDSVAGVIGENPDQTTPPTGQPVITVVPAITSVAISTVVDPIADHYQYKICEGSDCTFADQIGRVYDYPYSMTFSGLTGGTTYRAASRAENEAGSGPWSAWVNFDTLSDDGPPTEAPGIPTMVATPGDTTITLTVVDPVPDQYTNYDYRLCEGAGCTSFDYRGRDQGTPYTFTGLTPGTTYGYWARTQNSVGNSIYSSPQYVNTLGGTDPDPDPDPGPDPDPPGELACTDGTDCRCDYLVSLYGDNIVFCEDFENPTLGDPGVWQTTGGGWQDQAYSGINNYCKGIYGKVPSNNDDIPNDDMTNNGSCVYLLERDDASTQPGAGPSETQIPLADQTFDGNVSLMQTLRPQDTSVTVTADDGTEWPLHQPGGFHGNAVFSRIVTDFGITTARYTATSVENLGAAWKGNQYTNNEQALLGTYNTTNCQDNADGQAGNYPTGLGTNLEPYSGTIWDAEGDNAEAGYVNNVGKSCIIGTGGATKIKSRPAERDAPLVPRGQWVCQQVQYEGWGTPDGRVRHWIDGELIIDVSLDMSNPKTSWIEAEGPGLKRFKWNNYFNGSAPGGANNWNDPGQLSTRNQGWQEDFWSGRLQDNLVVKDGAPVPCDEIGFGDPEPPVAVCTDGVDCRCDELVDEFGSDIVFCEDFENPRLTEKGVWQKNPSSLQGAGWNDQGYGGITQGCAFSDDNGTIVPQGGSVYGQAQIVNVDRCIELNDANRQSAIPGISEFQVFDGNISLAQLNQPVNAYPELPLVNGNPDWQAGGKQGTAQLDRPVKTFGVTRAMLTTSNVDELGVAWKDDQWGGNDFGVWGTVNPITPSNPPVQPCTTPAGGWDMYPFAGTVWNWGGTKSTYTEVEGHGCDTGKLKHYPDTTTYTPPEPNTWVCQQFAYTNWGENNMRFRYWQDGELIVDLQDIDATSAQQDVNLNGLDEFSWNNYFNGIASGANDDNLGYRGTTYSGRLKDNVVVKEGEPVSCEAIGF